MIYSKEFISQIIEKLIKPCSEEDLITILSMHFNDGDYSVDEIVFYLNKLNTVSAEGMTLGVRVRKKIFNK